MTTQERHKLSFEITNALGSFSRYMNSPLRRAHVLTWRLANELDPHCPMIRLLRANRNQQVNDFRTRLARRIKLFRSAKLIRLPIYDEKTAQYLKGDSV